MVTLEDLSAKLDALVESLRRLEEKVAFWEGLIPEADTLAGRALARRLRRPAAGSRSAVDYLEGSSNGQKRGRS